MLKEEKNEEFLELVIFNSLYMDGASVSWQED